MFDEGPCCVAIRMYSGCLNRSGAGRDRPSACWYARPGEVGACACHIEAIPQSGWVISTGLRGESILWDVYLSIEEDMGVPYAWPRMALAGRWQMWCRRLEDVQTGILSGMDAYERSVQSQHEGL